MAKLIDAVGDAVDSPESAWEALAPHKAIRLAGIALGLASFSRLVTIILDVHRLSLGGSFDERTMEIVLGTLVRGSIWHSTVIAACGLAVILAGCSITAVAISKAGRSSKYGSIFIELLTATTFRLPIIPGAPPAPVDDTRCRSLEFNGRTQGHATQFLADSGFPQGAECQSGLHRAPCSAQAVMQVSIAG